MSYRNLIMYTLATPSFASRDSGADDGRQEWDDSLDANNPDNFNDDEEQII